MNTYNVIIIDDDLENINILKIYLNKFCPEINVVGEATNVNDGLAIYTNTQPDILLLDIELGNDTIFSFIDAINNIKGEIIFISSHPEFGVKAVNYNVTGFIVKPINPINLKKIITKAIFNIEKNKKNNALNKNNNKTCFPLKIAIPSTSKIELIDLENISYLEADGKYTVFHLKDNSKKIASRNLGEYEKIIDTNIFFRIHHRYLVNINSVTNVHKTDGYYCQLINNKNLPIAKRRQEAFHKFLRLK